jgi:hypothetical protein
VSRKKTNRNVLRFAVGTPERPFAPAVRVWTQGANAYIAVRQLGGVLKVSLHLASGVWVGAFTQESGVAPAESDGNRRVIQWNRPQESRPGWTHGTVILMPQIDDMHDVPFPADDSQFDSVIWVPTPAIGNVVQIVALLASDPTLRPVNELVMGSLPLSNGETLWLWADERQVQPEERKTFLEGREKVKVTMRQGADAEFLPGAISWFTESSHGPPMLVQIPLGSHNFDAPPMP